MTLHHTLSKSKPDIDYPLYSDKRYNYQRDNRYQIYLAKCKDIKKLFKKFIYRYCLPANLNRKGHPRFAHTTSSTWSATEASVSLLRSSFSSAKTSLIFSHASAAQNERGRAPATRTYYHTYNLRTQTTLHSYNQEKNWRRKISMTTSRLRSRTTSMAG